MRKRLIVSRAILAPALAGCLVTGVFTGVSSATPKSATTTPTAPLPAWPDVPPGVTALKAPAIPGVPPLPGPVAKPASESDNMGLLSVTPDQGVIGTPMTISGSGLQPNATVEITWSTADATWLVQTAPDTVSYRGTDYRYFNVVAKTVTTNAKGSFETTWKVPADWGGIHNIYAVVNGVEVAHGGFTVMRTLTITPKSGPIGTPITVTYSGLAPTLYTAGAELLWDNHYVGEMMANWTRGIATATIPAAGPVGKHFIQVGNAISYLYLNVPQSPIPYTNGGTATFTVTNGKPVLAPSINWPVNVAPTTSARTTLIPGRTANNGVVVNLATTRAQVGTKVPLSATGVDPGSPVTLEWATVVGNRVNCKGICWSYASTPLGNAMPTAGSLHTDITVPDGLGGWHVVQLVQKGHVLAQVPFYVEESIVGNGVSSLVVKENQPFTIHLEGVGWTQVDNTIAVDYDNSYIGYGCGFNSNGDVVLDLYATGGPGVHLIDIYPMLYTLSPSFANTPYGMVPLLTYANDDPALALGYHLPALRFAITVVK